MRFCTIPMNLYKRANEKRRKTHRSISDKSIQEHTSLNGNRMKMRDRPYTMIRKTEKQIVELRKLMGSDTRINTPSNGSTSDK